MTRTLAQMYSPAEIRGRAIGLFNVGSLGAALSADLLSVLAEALSVSTGH